MDIRDQIYDLLITDVDRNENRNETIHDKYIIKRGHSPNGWYSLSNRDRIRLQMAPVVNSWDYVQLNDMMFLWYSGNTIKKLIAYADYADGTNRAYYEGDFHIESIIRRRIPPTVLTRKYCMICADNLLGREIRSFFVDLGNNDSDSRKGFFDVHLYDKDLYCRRDIPQKIDSIWPFNKWFQRQLSLRPPAFINISASER